MRRNIYSNDVRAKADELGLSPLQALRHLQQRERVQSMYQRRNPSMILQTPKSA